MGLLMGLNCWRVLMTNWGGSSGMVTGTSSGRISMSSSVGCKAFIGAPFLQQIIILACKINLVRAVNIARGEKNVKVLSYREQGCCRVENQLSVLRLRGIINCCFGAGDSS